jgi:tRNA A-37 threonylcarbamoyl transferase component Bud32
MSKAEAFSPQSEGADSSLPELVPELHGFASAWTDPPPSGSEEDPLLGVTLNGTYRIQRVLGEGGMGRVYEAQHTRIQQKLYAIKVLHPEFTRDTDILARFQREAEAAACLSHPAAVGVFDVARTPQGWPYLVCEHLTGQDLSELIKAQGPLPATTAQHIALQVCGALAEAHANGVIHRDLKPQNVFVVGRFEGPVPEHPIAKVLDFGLSRILNGPNTANLTRTGVILGTPSYMSPEQARGERADQRTDIYGLGAVLYASVTGVPPFRCETPQATMLAVLNDEPVRPSKLNTKIPPRLELVIQRAMAKNPDQRYPSMEALRADLEHAVDPIDWVGDTVAVDAAAALGRAPLATVHSEIGASRFQLFGLTAALVLLATFAFATGVAGLVLLRWERWPLTRVETVLSALLVVGTLLTPAVLWARRFHRRVWGNTARVVEVLARLRETTVAALVTYGIGALAVVFFDTVLLEIRPPSTAARMWAGTGPLLLAAAVSIAAAFSWSSISRAPGGWATQSGDKDGARRRAFWAGPGLKMATYVVLVGGFAAVLAGRWTSGDDAAAEQPAPRSPVAISAEPPTTFQPKPPEPALAAPSVKAPPAETTAAPEHTEPGATGSELSAAVSQGLQEGLLPLLRKYPNDPKVLRATAVAQASSAATLGDAMGNFQRLLTVSPESAEDKDIQHILLQTTRTTTNSAAAFELLASSMGSVGADLLFRLALTESEQRDTARKYLARPQVHKKFTEALSIAYDLQFAQSCSARLRLLERAKRHGDERSVRVLSALARGLKRGCGPKQRQPCKPPCPAQAEQFLQTVEAINARMKLGQ